MTTNDGVDLWVETYGSSGNEAVLLNAGTSCSMDWWPAEMCRRLAERGLFVVRFDQRDTGRASFDPPGHPSYSLRDLVEDSFTVLDHLGLSAAHFAGFSQGGWISQLAALDRPERVRSIALISTRPTGHGPADADLPEVSDALMASWSEMSEPDWHDPDDVIRYLIDGERSVCGEEFDEQHARGIAEACVGRARQVQSAVTNHPIADQGSRWRERLHEISTPCVVVHGTADPMFPIGNAETLVREIHGAEIVRLPGVGHELPPRVWEYFIDVISRHVHEASNG